MGLLELRISRPARLRLGELLVLLVQPTTLRLRLDLEPRQSALLDATPRAAVLARAQYGALGSSKNKDDALPAAVGGVQRRPTAVHSSQDE